MQATEIANSRKTMGRPKKGKEGNERRTMMVRTYEEFAELVAQGARERGITAAEFCEQFLTPCAKKAHKDYVDQESKRLKDEEE